ncbi:MAG: lytic transglycosylase domain-containing protein [Leptospirales bacterium]|jgi:soluble lytic murein transglycosylase-like protein
MDSFTRIDAIQNRVGDIIQKVSSKMGRFEAGPTNPGGIRPGSRAAAFLNPAERAPANGHQAPNGTGGPGEAARSPQAAGNGPAGAARYGGPAASGATGGFAAELEQMIQQEASNQAVSPELIRAVVQAESGGRPNARSKAGALGLMQLMPGTARELGVDPKNPRENIRGGVQYLNQMAGKFGDLDLALAAYNAGPGAVKKYGGVPPYRETIDYISRIRKTLGETER